MPTVFRTVPVQLASVLATLAVTAAAGLAVGPSSLIVPVPLTRVPALPAVTVVVERAAARRIAVFRTVPVQLTRVLATLAVTAAAGLAVGPSSLIVPVPLTRVPALP